MHRTVFRAIRRKAGMTQAQLARLFGLADRQAIRRYETSADRSMARAVPPPVARLMWLIDNGRLADVKAADAMERGRAGLVIADDEGEEEP